MTNLYTFLRYLPDRLAPVAGWLLALALLLGGLAAQAQAPAWQAAVALTTSARGSAYANAVTTDAAGNVYVAGQFSGTVNLGSFSLTNSVNSLNNGFVAKWSVATRSFVWARQLGGAVHGVAVVGSSVYAVGYFLDTASFGSTTLTSTGDYDLFVVKLADAGSSNTVAWVKQAGGTGSDRPQAIVASPTGVYVSGVFAQAATFGPVVLAMGSANNAFVAKLTDSGSTGAFTWVQPIVTSYNTNAFGLAVAGNAVYVSGVFEQAAQFGSTALAGGAGNTAYVAKLLDAGTTGSFSWAKAPSAPASNMYALGVAVAGTAVYVTGAFAGTVTFGTQTLTAAGNYDVYVTKLTDSGPASTFVWAQQAGGSDDELAQEVVVNGNSVYITGSFRGTASFGSTSLTSIGGSDLFVTRLTDTGTSATFGWTQQAGGMGNDGSYALALSGTMPVVAGSFNVIATFGTQAITSTGQFSENAFLALLGPDVLATSAPAPAAAAGCYPNPAHGVATVQVPAGATPVPLTLLDGLGRVARTALAPAGAAYALDLTGLAPGVYALRVEVEGVAAVRKLVVE